jgi:hypothetical protein
MALTLDVTSAAQPMSQSMAESWRSGAAKAFERQYAAIADQYAAVA